jgi:Flp pilus assembly protein TadB
MDDKELIKRIMEEVRDEKLREELLALVAEKNRRQSEAKQEEKLINRKTRHGIPSKVGWGIYGIIGMLLLFLIFLVFGPLAALGYGVLFIISLLITIIIMLSSLAEETRKK